MKTLCEQGKQKPGVQVDQQGDCGVLEATRESVSGIWRVHTPTPSAAQHFPVSVRGHVLRGATSPTSVIFVLGTGNLMDTHLMFSGQHVAIF